MTSYFFIPATKISKINYIQELGVDNIIIDLEDSVKSAGLKALIEEINECHLNFWFRVPLRDGFHQEYLQTDVFHQLLAKGVRRFVIPKIYDAQEFLSFISAEPLGSNLEVLLLVEHPKLLKELSEIAVHLLEKTDVKGFGLGSHDLLSVIGAEHVTENLSFPRNELLYSAKAYGKIAVDIASMNIRDENEFIKEVRNSRKSGFDGKFLIHPTQLIWFNSEKRREDESIVWAKKIIENLPRNYDGGDIEPFILDGSVIEKPHVVKAKEILKNFEYGK